MPYLKTSLLLLLLVLALVGNLIAPSSAADIATNELCHPDDKRALLRIKKQLTNTPINLTVGLWDPATDCCGWSLVSCDPTTNRVDDILLTGFETKGPPFPSAFGNLPFLNFLTVTGSNLSGPIPASLAKLRHLTQLDLRGNLLSGPIPAFLANLRNLTSLNLRFNRLSGPIPSFLGTFQNLGSLELSNNLFSGAIPPSLSLAPNLSILVLDNNKLTGTIPESFGSFKSVPLERLSLANNELSGEVPRSFKKATIYWLDISGNKLEGDASFLFSKDKTVLIYLDISRNSFSFDMTNSTFTISLSQFYLTDNKIFGSLPEALAELPSLGFFNVSYNQLCGHIPRGNLKKFDNTCYLHNKCLCGTPLPHCR